MPHYKCGTEAKIGDACRFKTGVYTATGRWVPVLREGIVVDIQPGCTTCNAKVLYPVMVETGGVKYLQISQATVTLAECEKAGLPIEEPATTSS